MTEEMVLTQKRKEVVDLPLELVESAKVKLREVDSNIVEELAQSIEAKGLQSPILVRKIQSHYEVVFGEHRLEAFKKLKRSSIPCFVEQMDGFEAAERKVIENIQRNSKVDINVEGQIYKQLIDEKYKTSLALSKSIGRSPQYIEERIRVAVNLQPELKQLIGRGLTIRNAVELAKETDLEKQIRVGRKLADLNKFVDSRTIEMTEDYLRVRSTQKEKTNCSECHAGITTMLKKMQTKTTQPEIRRYLDPKFQNNFWDWMSQILRLGLATQTTEKKSKRNCAKTTEMYLISPLGRQFVEASELVDAILQGRSGQ